MNCVRKLRLNTTLRLRFPQLSVVNKRFFNERPWERYEKSDGQENKDKKSLVTVWLFVGVVVTTAGALAYVFDRRKEEYEKKTIAKRPISMGKAKIGGPFQLKGLNNEIVTNENFKGKWVLLYFGFTNCPDICPDELEKMSKVHSALKESGYNSVPVFVSVDPERDTPEKISSYLKEFHEDFVGLHGNLEEVTKVVKTFKVYFNKGPKDEDGDYIVDHSIICYLLNPEGSFVEYFGQNKTSTEMLTSVKQHIMYGTRG